MLSMTTVNPPTSFAGDNNQGFQVGSNQGNVHVSFGAQPGSSKMLDETQARWRLTVLSCLVEGSPPKPNPSSTVPFRRDSDFVYRDILAEVKEKCSKPASRAALVGLGGVG